MFSSILPDLLSIFFLFFFRIWYQMQRYNTGDSYDPDHQNKVAMNQNMSTLEQDLKKQILGRSKAEKVFRPWWDTVEDYLLNCLVLLGKNYNHSNMKLGKQVYFGTFCDVKRGVPQLCSLLVYCRSLVLVCRNFEM